MGQTRVDLLHLLEDLRDAYPGDLEETILTEIVANSLDSGARHLRVLTDPVDRTLVVVDDGRGMGRRELSRYHDVAASTKERGEGIGFAGVGIKLGLLVAEEVLTETRRGETHVATRWHLASRQRAPWNWTPPPGWVSEKGTAVGLRLRNPLSPLLDPGYVEAALRRHFEPLLDSAFDDVLAEHYSEGITFAVNGRAVEKRQRGPGDRAPVEVRLPKKRKAAALGYIERFPESIPEDRQGIAISTLGKVIRRGWDWLGVTCTSPTLVAGLVEAPGLAAVLTLNKGDFVRAGRRGITYLAYRKAVQEAASRQLAVWGEARDREDTARRRAARPLEKDLETVLV
ncbi:MAG TPA: ATP-binding protein, partial [Vicinamibacteria bacterium]